MGYYGQSGIINKNIGTHRNSSEPIGTHNTNLSQAPQPNFLSEGVRLGLDKEIAPDGTYLAYFPFGAMIERSQMTPYHKKLTVGAIIELYNRAIV